VRFCAEAFEALARGVEPEGASRHPLPGVFASIEPPEDVLDREAARLDPAELVPRDRHGDGSARPRAHRIGRDGGLRPGVARDVEEDPPAPRGLPHLGRELVRTSPREQLHGVARERAHRVEVGAAVERDDEVHALRSGDLREGREPERVEELATGAGGVPHGGEVVAGRVEVDAELVRVVQAVDAAQPRVKRDASLVREIDERGLRAADRELLASVADLLDPDGRDPVREVLPDLLLVEALGFDPVGESLQNQRPVLQPREHVRRDPLVVPDQIALGQTVVGEEDLVFVRELDRVAPETSIAHPGPSPRGSLRYASAARIAHSSAIPATNEAKWRTPAPPARCLLTSGTRSEAPM